MKWLKRGKIFNVSGEFGWMNSHAQVPTVLEMKDRLRVYFATRPSNDLGLTTFLDLDRHDPKRIIYVHDKPILQPGSAGLFDNHGVFPSCVRWHDGKVYLYYLGWYRGSSVAYHNAIGLAISEDEGVTFRKYSPGPILDRSPFEPYSTMSLYIFQESGKFFMYYTVVYDWISVKDKYEPAYHIGLATSEDGICWQKAGRICIAANYHGECIARPAIIKRGDIYHMWMAFRGSKDFRGGADSYQIGYAWSTNLVDWKREDDQAGIQKSVDGWDSSMITYPCVIALNDRHLMFYNGNGFGASGFGYATAEW